jgi:glycosyltransferase involved in cell wall biosynthesis
MKIAIDARESGTTTGRYIDKLIEYLHSLQPQYEIVVLTKTPRLSFFADIAPNFRTIAADHKEFTFDEQIGFRKQLDGLKADLIHFGKVEQPVFYKGKTVTTMHDLTTLRFKNPSKNSLVFVLKQKVYAWVNKKAARKATFIITPTEFVKQDVVHYTGIDPNKVVVTYESADAITLDAEPLVELVNKQFIMYVGRPTPHKNLERLIEAFASLHDRHPDLQLVLVGKKDTNYERIEALVTSQDIPNVYFTNFISEGQLRWLYENCSAYVFPSLSEGFGLPSLEAMIHGAPVVSSNATCLPEVNGDAAHYFDPLDTPAMATAIHDVLTDTALRQQLIAAGYKQVRKYSWQHMARQTLAVYEQSLK